MVKPTKRKAFSFLRSYFDALNEIPDKDDKYNFLISIIDKQFLDENPKNLTLIAKLSYEGQRHSIEKSVKGYKDKMKTNLDGTPLVDPKQGGSVHPLKDPKQQEKEKGKEQVKEEVEEEVEEENTFHNVETLKKHYLTKTQILKAVIDNKKNKVKDLDDLKAKLNLFCIDLVEQGRLSENWKEFTSYFRNSLKIGKFDAKPNKPTTSKEHKPKIAF